VSCGGVVWCCFGVCFVVGVWWFCVFCFGLVVVW
jgi:hypothetical protein